jgi:formate-dependent phosphoribosylglycinamide formyltransferase (GAR transformylase)
VDVKEIEPKIAQTSASANRESNSKRNGKKVRALLTKDVERQENKIRVFGRPAIHREAKGCAIAAGKRIQRGRAEQEDKHIDCGEKS